MFLQLCGFLCSFALVANGVKEGLLQTSVTALDTVQRGADAIKPVITMLQAMEQTLADEAHVEDERKSSLMCWCKTNREQKKFTIDSSSAKVIELRSTIDGAIAKEAELKAAVKEASESSAAGEQALAEAEQVRKEQRDKYDNFMLESRPQLKALENGVRILERYDKSALPQLQEEPSLLQLDSESSADDILARKLDDFMRHHGYDTGDTQPEQQVTAAPEVRPKQSSSRSSKFLEPRVQDAGDAEDIGLLMERAGDASQPIPEVESTTTSSARPYLKSDVLGLSSQEQASVNSGLAVAAAFVQASGGDSAELFGNGLGQLAAVLRTTKESLEEDVEKAKKQEKADAENFLAMKLAKMQETNEAGGQLGVKKTELSRVSFLLITSKKDLKQETELLKNTKEALQTLEETCEQGLKNSEERQEKRAEEIKGVNDALEELGQLETAEEESKATSFLQLSEDSSRGEKAAAALRSAAASADASDASQLEVLASSAEVEAFDEVMQAIAKNVDELKKKDRAAEKKRNWCKEEILENKKDIEKAAHQQTTQEVQANRMKEDVELYAEELKKSKDEKLELETQFKKATDDLQKQHDAYMRIATDNELTLKAISKAKEKLKGVYGNGQALVQTGGDPNAPGSNAEYSKNRMGSRVIVLLGYLQQEAQEMIDKGSASESQAQESYGKLAYETKKNVEALQLEINTKEAAVVKLKEDLVETQKNAKGLIAEQADLKGKMSILNSECDELVRNFDDMKKARFDEMQALKEAKGILQGAASG